MRRQAKQNVNKKLANKKKEKEEKDQSENDHGSRSLSAPLPAGTLPPTCRLNFSKY
jgi:hypothetical protein